MKIKFILSSIVLFGGIFLFFNRCAIDEEPAAKLEIGTEYGGGIIFYVDSTGQHGFICASYDQGTALTWNNGTDVTTNATGAGYGTGLANTEAIVSVQKTGNYAAKICSDLDINGYDDWFLPSKSECFTMYFNLKIMRDIGHFTDTLYWSSTEASVNNAYSQYGNDGYPPNGGYYKNTTHYVRAIRSF
ncbi:MAG: DUF1566 domain-containing protein [Bacteroidales bacterium]|nr:DUF1566 domain-containing protein [Bacteroidales bacterium]